MLGFEYEKNTPYCDPPDPPNRKIWGKLFFFPILFSFCLSGYEFLDYGAFLTMRTAVIVTSLLVIPLSYALMCTFYLGACVVRFVISKQPLTGFWMKIAYYPFVFGGWYCFISLIYPVNSAVRSLFIEVQSRSMPYHTALFFLLSICALAILLKAHMSILNYRGKYDDAAEEAIPPVKKAAAYVLVILINLVCILF